MAKPLIKEMPNADFATSGVLAVDDTLKPMSTCDGAASGFSRLCLAGHVLQLTAVDDVSSLRDICWDYRNRCTLA